MRGVSLDLDAIMTTLYTLTMSRRARVVKKRKKMSTFVNASRLTPTEGVRKQEMDVFIFDYSRVLEECCYRQFPRLMVECLTHAKNTGVASVRSTKVSLCLFFSNLENTSCIRIKLRTSVTE